MEKKTLTPMLQKLREYLANTPREQIDRDWAEAKALGLKGISIREFIKNFKNGKSEFGD